MVKVTQDYGASDIKVPEGLENIRKKFDVVGLSKKIRKQFISKSMLYKIGERNE